MVYHILAILRLLSEEVFDFGTGLTTARSIQLKQQFCGQFEEIHRLCYEILENSDNAQLIYATLSTLHGFLDWIPVGYVFENNLIDLILKVLTHLIF
jgi:exportin-1